MRLTKESNNSCSFTTVTPTEVFRKDWWGKTTEAENPDKPMQQFRQMALKARSRALKWEWIGRNNRESYCRGRTSRTYWLGAETQASLALHPLVIHPWSLQSKSGAFSGLLLHLPLASTILGAMLVIVYCPLSPIQLLTIWRKGLSNKDL